MYCSAEYATCARRTGDYGGHFANARRTMAEDAAQRLSRRFATSRAMMMNQVSSMSMQFYVAKLRLSSANPSDFKRKRPPHRVRRYNGLRRCGQSLILKHPSYRLHVIKLVPNSRSAKPWSNGSG